MFLRQAVLVAAVFLSLPAFADSARPRIAIIIDDLGYALVAGERAIALPGPLAFAVLPGAPRSNDFARKVHATGRDVLLHLPLQAQRDDGKAEPQSLLLDMSREQFRRALTENIESVPHIVGINTHRGSLLTRHPGHMRWLMDEIVARDDLFFVDSYTTARSIALRIARESGVPAVKRDVFLDPDRSPQTLAREFARLKDIARRRGYAVGIGHPYPATLEFLEVALPALPGDGYDLVSIRELVEGAGQ